ncbi:DUF4175 domain-containing protein [Shimia sp.]|uniref:DUF4175 domain-containing protein n=1 Tax=Shimia sp. TaxID=1954381 RepID=UPI003563EAB5
MATPKHSPARGSRRLRRVLALTWLGLLAEALTRGFWPLWSLAILVVSALMLGLHDLLGLEALWLSALGIAAAALWALCYGLVRFSWPAREDAFRRLDATLPGRPLAALRDRPAMGAGDAGTETLWRAHQARMAAQAALARAPEPDLRLARFDPFGLRHLALLALMVALLFGSLSRVGSVAGMAGGGDQAPLSGPSWEGWLEPPSYTGKPSLYLADLAEGVVPLPEGSRVVIRLYGDIGALTVAETLSGRVENLPSAAAPEQEFTLLRSGRLAIEGPGGGAWQIEMQPDRAPMIAVAGAAAVSDRGEMSLPFEVRDDYAVRGGTARITLDLAAVPRRYGLAVAPEPMAPVDLPLPLPITGDRSRFEEALIEDFSAHVWAHLPVTVRLEVEDAAGQEGSVSLKLAALPARRFFDPLAAAVIELRRDLLWSRANAPRVVQLMRALSHQPDSGLFPDEASYLRYRTVLRRLGSMLRQDSFGPEQRDEITAAMWELALMLEEGDLEDVFARMERARDRLAEAMKNGASDAEIAQLMQELREATEDYLRELARRQNQPGEEGAEGDRQMAEGAMQLGQDDLQRMMDRIQELMEQGRMAEAMRALEEFQRLIENMRVAEGAGEGEPSPGEQALQDLSDTLREQQGLSDDAFRQLQEQFNPDANRGGSRRNEGYSGGEGRGQAHDGTGDGQGDGQGQGRAGQSGQDAGDGSLADRQEALRRRVESLRQQLPGRGTEDGNATEGALDRAGEAMEEAEEALRGDRLDEALEQQAQAMDALRDGLRSLAETMAQQGEGQDGRDQAGRRGMADPLGRTPGARGPAGSEADLLQGEDVYRQARRLLDEIRRRAGEDRRPEDERSYLRRLLDRF